MVRTPSIAVTSIHVKVTKVCQNLERVELHRRYEQHILVALYHNEVKTMGVGAPSGFSVDSATK